MTRVFYEPVIGSLTLPHPIIGDLNCSGVDIDAFEKACRIPLFPGQVNRWILRRTNRDEPSDRDVINSLRAVVSQFFKRSSDFGPLLDPSFVFKGTIRAGSADLVSIEQISRAPIAFPTGERAVTLSDCAHPITIRDEADKGPPVYVEIRFAYRGQTQTMPWPVHKVPPVYLPINANCPAEADWAVVEVGTPVGFAPPEKSTTEKAGEVLSETTEEAAESVRQAAGGVLKTLVVPALALGALGFLLLRR